MYKSIICPVDLAHKDTLTDGIAVAADLAKHYGGKLTLIGVTPNTPSPVAHNPQEYEEHLREFAKEIGNDHELEVASEMVVSHDPAVDLEDHILETSKTLSADLIVMASHKPGLLDYLLPTHASAVSTNTDLSVFIVR